MFKLPLVRGDPAEIVGNGGPDAQDEPGKWPDRRRRDCRSATKPAAGRPPRLAASRSSCKRRVLAAGPVSKRAAANAEVLIDLERCAGMDDDQQSHRCQEIAAEPDDPEVCGPAPEQRYRLHRKRATMSMPWLLVSATAVGQNRPRRRGDAGRILLQPDSPANRRLQISDVTRRSTAMHRHPVAGARPIRPARKCPWRC